MLMQWKVPEVWLTIPQTLLIDIFSPLDMSLITVTFLWEGFLYIMSFDSYRYRDNIKRMSDISKDEPESSLDRAVWWAEYIIRHKGTKHLRSAALDLAWYQYLLLDIVALIFVIFSVTICILYLSLKNIYMYMTENSYKVKSKHD